MTDMNLVFWLPALFVFCMLACRAFAADIRISEGACRDLCHRHDHRLAVHLYGDGARPARAVLTLQRFAAPQSCKSRTSWRTNMWSLHILLLAVTILLSAPLSRYFVLIMARHYEQRWLGRFEAGLDTGKQNWARCVVPTLDRPRVAGASGVAQALLRPIGMAA
jgi:hypothetical protein